MIRRLVRSSLVAALTLAPLIALAGPQDSRVGETRVLYAATGTPIKAEPTATGAQVAVLPFGTQVQLLEVKLPWVKVKGARAGPSARRRLDPRLPGHRAAAT